MSPRHPCGREREHRIPAVDVSLAESCAAVRTTSYDMNPSPPHLDGVRRSSARHPVTAGRWNKS
eukprot:9653036-Prorocentrum_lima.AAC.1